MNKKTKILGYCIFVVLIIFLIGFYSNDILIDISYASCEDDGDTSDTDSTGDTSDTSDTDDDILHYHCNYCSSSGKCIGKVSSTPCYSDCSGCESYSCKVCSGGKCVTKSFDAPCNNTCHGDDRECGGGDEIFQHDTMSCQVCSGGQCVSKSLEAPCSDECTHPDDCVGSSPTTTKEKKSGWHCKPATETCYEAKKTSHGFSTQAQCEAYCVYCNACVKQWFGLWGEETCRENYKYCSTGGTDQCQTDADCQPPGATTPPTASPEPTRYECLSDGTCVADPSGSHSSEQVCNDNCYSLTPRCTVRATANPNPIPEEQNQVSISATNLKNTSLSKCKVSGYSLPHTFTQTISSKVYTVSCTGNSGYSNCSNSIKVTLGGATPDTTTTTTTAPPDCQGTSPTTSSSTTTTTTAPPCVINKFELPKRAWVDIETIASWSTNNCDTAEIRCISDDCIEGVENLSGSVEPGFPTKSKNFTIKAPGTYRYELEACGPGPNNCKTYKDVLGTGLEYIEIEALHLPWWQEIIPVLPDNLQGFLRGLIN